MIPGDEPRLFSSPDESVDSAISPDARLVTFRKLVHSRWQLGYLKWAGEGKDAHSSQVAMRTAPFGRPP